MVWVGLSVLFAAATPAHLHSQELQIPVTMLRGHSSVVWSVAFSPDGKSLASVSQDGIRIWDVETAAPVRKVRTGGIPFQRVVFTPDGQKLVGTAQNSGQVGAIIHLWDTKTWDVVRMMDVQGQLVEGIMALSPDGKFLATDAGYLGRFIKVWDLASGRPVRTLLGHESAVKALAFSVKAPWLASGGDDASLRIWELPTGRLLRVITRTPLLQQLSFYQTGGRIGAVRSLAWSPDARILATASGTHDHVSDRLITLWDPAAGAAIKELGVGESDSLWVSDVAFSPDGDTVAGNSPLRGRLDLWSAGSEKHVATFFPDCGVRPMAFSPNGKLLAAGCGTGVVMLWRLKP